MSNCTTEEWRRVYRIRGAETFVSNMGKIKENGEFVEIKYNNKYPYFGCMGVHRLVALAFLGETPKGKRIHHIDGQKSNPCLDNLEFVDSTEHAERHKAMGTFKAPQRRPVKSKIAGSVPDLTRSLSLDESTYEKISEMAKESRRSWAKMARYLIETALKNEGK